MPTNAHSSQGTTVEVFMTPDWALVPYLVNAPTPAIRLAFDDITNLDSPEGFPERIAVGKEFSTVSFEGIWDGDNAVHQFLQEASAAQSLLQFRETLTDAGGTVVTYEGYVSVEIRPETRRAVRVTITIEVTGDITITP